MVSMSGQHDPRLMVNRPNNGYGRDLDTHISKDRGDPVNRADKLRMGGFELSQRFLQLPKGGVRIVVRRSCRRRKRETRERACLASKLREKLFKLASLRRR